MEIERLVSALEQTIALLQNSQSSAWATMSVEELIQELEVLNSEIKNSSNVDKQLLGSLFAPTTSIQETAIDNGWGDEFLSLSEVVDSFTSADNP